MYSINSLISLALLASPLTTSANPLIPRALAIPSIPADVPLRPTGDGIGPWNSQPAGPSDQALKVTFYSMAAGAEVANLPAAARNMRHYLGNTGAPLFVQPEDMMKGMPQLREDVRTAAKAEAAAAYKRITAASGEIAFSSAWKQWYATEERSKNWYYAIGGFHFSVTGVVTKSGGGAGGSLKYVVHIFDRYNWDAGKKVDILGWNVPDLTPGQLHLKGLAREYIVRGSGFVNNVPSFTPATVIPLPLV